MLDGTRKESTSKEETTEGNQLTHIWIGIILRCFQMPLKESSLAYYLNIERFGFGYGTLESHIERGEERFCVEYHPDKSVWYDILAFSQPNKLLAKLGYPLVRHFQRQQ